MENRGTQSSGSRSTGPHWRHDPGAIPYTFGPSSAPFYEQCSWPAEIFLWPLFSFPEPRGRAHIPGALPLALSLLLSRCPFSLMLSELLCAVSMLLFTSMREKQTLGGDTLFVSARRL